MSRYGFSRPPAVVIALFMLGAALISGGCNNSAAPAPPPSANGAMYITDFSNNAMYVYSQGANCNCGSARTIQGGNTGMLGPSGIAFAGGTIYTANEGANSVTEYPGLGNGNIRYSFRILGFQSPIGVAVDTAKNLYVANSAIAGGTPSIEVFAPQTTTPILTISGAATGLSTPGYLALDAAGNIWVANQSGNSIEEFPSLANNPGGNEPPMAVISGNQTQLNDPQGIAFGPSGLLYAVVDNPVGLFDEVLIFAPPLSGNKAPVNAICGPNTGVNNPTGVAVNSLGTVFVVNSATSVAGYITAFASNNIGNLNCTGSVPNASVGGNNTPLTNPVGIALH